MRFIKNLLFFFSLFLLTSLSARNVFASDITSQWISTTSLPYIGASHISFSFSNKVYILGGSAQTGFSHDEITGASQAVNGQLGSWSEDANFLTAPIFHAIASAGNNVYILGGREENPGTVIDHVNKVFLGKLGETGIGVWTQQTSLPQNSSMGAAAIINNRIYFSGGFNNSGQSNMVYSAPINPDGSLGPWAESGQMPQARRAHGMIEHNGHLIIMGGDSNGTYLNTVYMATPDGSGNISSWQQLNSLPGAVYRGAWVKTGDTILSIAGYNGSVDTDKIFYATLDNDGTVSLWQESTNHLPVTLHGGSAAVLGSYLYYIGGYRLQSDSYQSSVYFTNLNLETNLNVPLLKQTDPNWGSQIYNSANLWSSANPGIDRWGCALTSAAMVFQYHGITKLPDGEMLDPGTLNTWLKSQNDGYVGSGWVNWLALSRLSKVAKSQNPSFGFNALKYKRLGGYNPLQLKEDLENNIPGILEEPGHFIVGKGTLGNSFSINDPFYNRTSLSEYSDTFSSLGRFIPSNTDLSYIMLIVEEGIDLVVKDSNGNIVGEGFLQQPLDEDGGSSNSVEGMNFYYIPTPLPGSYSVEVSSNNQQSYNLEGYFYDEDGEVNKKDESGIATETSKDIYIIEFNKQDSSMSNMSIITLDSLIYELDNLYNDSHFKNYGGYNSLRVKLVQAKKLIDKGKLADAKSILQEFIEELDSSRGKRISEEAYLIIKPQATALYNSL